MIELHNLQNTSRPKKKVQRVGRGPGSGRGKTSCRGGKGQSARSGSTRRYGYEGGQMRLFRKLPCRGFTRGRFEKAHLAINLSFIQEFFEDGDLVNLESLRQKGYADRLLPGGLKILADGELDKKVVIEAAGFSKEAIRKLEEKKISYKIVK